MSAAPAPRPATPATGTLTAVCVVHALLPAAGQGPGVTAIDKRLVAGRVEVGELGLAGDTQCDTRHHGGEDKAVYVYADADANWWAGELGRGIPPGLFGENLRVSGVDVSGAEIGERWQIGGEDGIVVEVAGHRTPCSTFANRMGVPRWSRRFTERRAPGAYLRVLRPGSVAVGDEVTVLSRPGHGVTVAGVSGTPEPELMSRLLAAADAGTVDLAPAVRRHAARAAARA